MAFLTDGTVGADLDAATSAAKFALGDIAAGDKGSRWMYVQASTTIGQYDFVGVDEDYKANPLSSTMAAAGYVVGAAQIAVPISEYFWLALEGRGNINGKVASSCAADVALYTTTTAGVLDDSATATQTLVEGVVIVTTQSSTTGLASGTELISTYPRGR
jgi:hypothetical protein